MGMYAKTSTGAEIKLSSLLLGDYARNLRLGGSEAVIDDVFTVIDEMAQSLGVYDIVTDGDLMSARNVFRLRMLQMRLFELLSDGIANNYSDPKLTDLIFSIPTFAGRDQVEILDVMNFAYDLHVLLELMLHVKNGGGALVFR